MVVPKHIYPRCASSRTSSSVFTFTHTYLQRFRPRLVGFLFVGQYDPSDPHRVWQEEGLHIINRRGVAIRTILRQQYGAELEGVFCKHQFALSPPAMIELLEVVNGKG